MLAGSENLEYLQDSIKSLKFEGLRFEVVRRFEV
jgi:hypothetical protein